jgi:2-polyprenyl-3-methyl-5-hydroxy-6-metoxy-1,4-benzoquinol methylase
MKAIDKYLQKVRINKAKKFVRKGDAVLDIGSVDGVMFESWKGYISSGVGVDPTLLETIKKDNYVLYPGYFPEACPKGDTYDIITLLAVLEHIPTQQQEQLALSCFNYLKPNGRVIITVPSPQVDIILDILTKLRLIDGMSLEEHFGFEPKDTPRIFSNPRFKLITHTSFQLGLNNLFVFERIG